MLISASFHRLETDSPKGVSVYFSNPSTNSSSSAKVISSISSFV